MLANKTHTITGWLNNVAYVYNYSKTNFKGHTDVVKRVTGSLSSTLKKIFRSKTIDSSHFSKTSLTIFSIIFAAIGGYLIYSSFAATPTTANLWIDQNGGSCQRSATKIAYSGAGDSNSCSTAQLACNAAASGDLILIRSGIDYDLNINNCHKTSMTIFQVPDDQDITIQDFSISNSDWITIDGGAQMALHTQTADDIPSVFSKCSNHVTLSHLEINGNGHDGDGFQVGWPNDCTSSYIQLDHNLIYGLVFKGGNHTDCIQAASSLNSFTIDGNRLYQCGDGAMQFTDGPAWGEYDPLTGLQNVKITNNWIKDKINFGFGYKGQGDLTFQGNTYAGNGAPQFNTVANQYIYGNIFDFFENFSCSSSSSGGNAGGTAFFRYNVSDVDCPANTNSTKVTPISSLFVNYSSGTPQGWDLHLANGTNPAVNAVPAGFYGTTDIDGHGRPVGAAGDAGADEFGSSPAELTANIWIAANGNDAGFNCKRNATAIVNPDAGGTSLCKTFDKAYELAQLGDTVIVTNGSYPMQTLDGPTKSGSGKVNLVGQSKAGTVVQGIDVKFVNHIAFKDFLLTDPSWVCPSGDPCGNNKMADFHDTADIELDNVDLNRNYKHGGGVGISGNNDGFTWKNSDICCNAEQKLIMMDPYWASPSVNNAMFDNLRVHDQVYLATSYPGEPPHAECWWMIRATNITIKNTKTYDCISTGDMIWGGAANSTGVLFQNTFWGGKFGFQNGVDVVPGPGVGYRGDGGGPIIDGNNTNGTGTIEYSTFDGGIVDDGWASLTLRSNIGYKFQFSCSSSSNYKYLYNIWSFAKCSNANGSDNDAVSTILDAPNYVNKAAGDWHLAAGAPQIDKGDPASYPAADADGTSRPVGARADVGMYEYTGSTSPPTPPPPPGPTPPPPPPPTAPAGLLLGNYVVEGKADPISTQQSEAWPFTATASGNAATAYLNLDSTSTATGIQLGLYADSSGSPGSLLATATIASPTSGWNSANFGSSPAITSGTNYWVAILGTGSGQVVVKDRNAGTCSAKVNALPNNWTSLHNPFGATSATTYTDCPISAYVTASTGPKQGDINGDNSVNITDLSLLLSSYGQTTTLCTTAKLLYIRYPPMAAKTMEKMVRLALLK